MRERLRARGFDVYSDLQTAVQRRGSVSAVTMIHVLEHLVAPDLALKQIHEALTPGGWLMIEVPNVDSLRARLSDSPLNRFFARPGQRHQAYPIHLYYFNVRSLRRLVSRHGFQPVAAHSTGMGIDELLRPLPRTGAPTAPPPSGSGPQGASDAEPQPSSRSASGGEGLVRLGKKAVKRLMSRLQLGEHVVLLCRKVDS